MKELKEYLYSLPAGSLNDQQINILIPLLRKSWSQFKGGDEEKMKDYKIDRGIEGVVWHPPELSFKIERHGPTVMGSIYAELHKWIINLEKGIAALDYDFKKSRQIYRKQPKVKVELIAEEIIQKIKENSDDNRLKWYKDGSVKILTGKISELEKGSAVRRTLEGRRKKIRLKMTELMKQIGWDEISPNLYYPGKTKIN